MKIRRLPDAVDHTSSHFRMRFNEARNEVTNVRRLGVGGTPVSGSSVQGAAGKTTILLMRVHFDRWRHYTRQSLWLPVVR